MTGIRDWGDEGATQEELALLRASRAEEPAAGARSRTLAALGVGAVLTAATTTTTTATAMTIAGASVKLVAKIALAVVVAGSASGLAWHTLRRPALAVQAPVAAVHAAPREVSEAPPAVEETPAAVEETPAAVEEAAPTAPAVHGAVATRSVHAHPAPSASSDTLSAQVAALEKAHAALAAHDPSAALRALDRYRSRFPDGALSSEEKVLRVQVALAQGDKSRAAALANELRAANPDSPYARRVGDLVSRGAPKH